MSGKIVKHDDQIIAQIQKQIIAGNTESDIINFVEKEFKVNNGELYFSKAVASFSNYFNVDKNIKKGFAMAATQELYRRMIEAGDYAGALTAIKEFSKLNNLYDSSSKKGKGIQKEWKY